MGRILRKEAIALGREPYIDKVQLAARQGGLSTSATTFWAVSAAYVQLTAAAAMEAVSSSANDAAAGTGARTIRVYGIDGNYDAIIEDVTLNGTTPVALVTSLIAVNKIEVLTAGSGLVNAGTIDVRTVTGSTVKNRINTSPILRGQTCSFLYTIPRKHIGLLSSVKFSSTGNTGDFTVYLLGYDSSGVEKGLGAAACSLSNTGFCEGKGEIDLGSGLLIPEKTLIELRGVVSAGTPAGYASAELLVIDTKNNGIF